MPVTNLLKVSRVHVGADLARIEGHYQHNKEHHVARKGTKNEGAGAIEHLPGTAPRVFPVIIAASAATTGGPAIYGRFAAGSWRFTLGL